MKMKDRDKAEADVDVARRRKIVRSNLGKLRAVGVRPSAYSRELAEQWARGEITTDERKRLLYAHYGVTPEAKG